MQYGDCYMIVSTAGNSVVYLPSYPEELSDNTSVNWAESGIIGRSTPIYSYNSTSARQLSFSFDLHREMPKYFGERYKSGSYDTYDVEKILETIRKSAYPEYENSGLKPPIVTFRFGEFKARGIIMSVGFTWKKPIVARKYQLCTVSISMNETPNSVRSANELYSALNPFNV